jgi:hypothetical protein
MDRCYVSTMTAYDLALDGNDLDLGYFLMRDGHVTMYRRTELLDADLAELRELGHHVTDVDASR